MLLVNARDVKNVPGRKTDVNDAQWIQQLHQYGLLRGSFRPHERVIQLRALMRHRDRLIEAGATHIQLMQKALMQMKVQLRHAVTDIVGLTGMRAPHRATTDRSLDQPRRRSHRNRSYSSLNFPRERLSSIDRFRYAPTLFPEEPECF